VLFPPPNYCPIREMFFVCQSGKLAIYCAMQQALQQLLPHAFPDTEMQDTGILEAVLQGGQEQEFNIRPASSYVNSPKNNGEKCLDAA
jgi:hypothetical protein